MPLHFTGESLAVWLNVMGGNRPICSKNAQDGALLKHVLLAKKNYLPKYWDF
jgi:hypothetical protein